MKSVIEEIQCGKSNRIDTFILNSPQYRKCVSDVCHSRANLEYDLSKNQLKALQQYNECIINMRSVAEIEAFKYGLMLGSKMNSEMQELMFV